MLEIDNEVLDRLKGSGDPVILTTADNTEIVVQDAASYRKLMDRLDELETLEGIERGLADVEAGRTMPIDRFFEEFRREHGLPSRNR